MKKRIILIHGIPSESFYESLDARKDIRKIYVTEFRPLLFGAQLVCRELLKRKLNPILICDNMVGFCLEKKMLDEINIFAKTKDEESAVCFVGSLIYAICANKNKAKIILSGAGKVKKAAKPADVLSFGGKRIAARGIRAYVPLWEKVPVGLISKISE